MIVRWRFTIPANIVRWQPDLAKTCGWLSWCIGLWLYGFLAILRPRSRISIELSTMRARSAKPPH